MEEMSRMKTDALDVQGVDVITASCANIEPTIEETLYAIDHMKGMIKGNKEVLAVIRLFASEKELQNDLSNTIKGQKRILRYLKKLLTKLEG